ncbi:MAG: hypothetical protein AAFO91_05705, partial [Bacteroidota bacterium]
RNHWSRWDRYNLRQLSQQWLNASIATVEDPGQGEAYTFASGVSGPQRTGPSGERTLQVRAGFRSL